MDPMSTTSRPPSPRPTQPPPLPSPEEIRNALESLSVAFRHLTTGLQVGSLLGWAIQGEEDKVRQIVESFDDATVEKVMMAACYVSTIAELERDRRHPPEVVHLDAGS